MKPVLLAIALAGVFFLPRPALSAAPAPTAVSGQVSGTVQQVGFRAMILKQAIVFKLAGTTNNNPNKTVSFVLQGDPARIKAALKIIAKGTARSANVKVTTAAAKVDPKLKTFTVVGWTSTSRRITTPYDLVFKLRKDDKTVTEKEAEKVYHQILHKTLKKEDLKKLKAAASIEGN